MIGRHVALGLVALIVLLFSVSTVLAEVIVTEYIVTCDSVTLTYTSDNNFGKQYARVEVFIENPFKSLHYSETTYSANGDTVHVTFDALPEGTVVRSAVYLEEVVGSDDVSAPCSNDVEDADSDDDGPLPWGPPCDNLFDGRINDSQALDCGAPVAIYHDAELNIVYIYGINPDTGDGQLAAAIPLATVPTDASANQIAVATTHPWFPAPLVFSRLSTGEWQVTTSYVTGKPYIVVWSTQEDLYHLAA